jgi:hypothetical protein
MTEDVTGGDYLDRVETSAHETHVLVEAEFRREGLQLLPEWPVAEQEGAQRLMLLDDCRKRPEERLVILRPLEARRDGDQRPVPHAELLPLPHRIEVLSEQIRGDRHVREDGHPILRHAELRDVTLLRDLAYRHDSVGEMACREVRKNATASSVAGAVVGHAVQDRDRWPPGEACREAALEVRAGEVRLDQVDALAANDRDQARDGARVPERPARDHEDASARGRDALDESFVGRTNGRDVGRKAVVVGQLEQAEQHRLRSADPEPVDHLEHPRHRPSPEGDRA